jgi:V/A-type H+-transporting ATPase subunit C
MADYDYGNARLRVMKSRLLTKKEFETLIGSGSTQGLIAALTKTNYRKSIEAALARTSGMECIAEALRADLISTLGKLRSFYSERSGKMVAILLRSYDIANLKAVLRGLAKNALPAEILATVMPVGDLRFDILNELASASRPRSAIDLLATMGLPVSQPLIHLRAEHPGAEVFEMELALERWHYKEAQQYLRSRVLTNGLLRSALDLDADLSNILTVLRFANFPTERKQIRERLGTESLEVMLCGPGKITFPLLIEAGSQDDVESAVDTLADTPYESPLRAGLAVFGSNGRLSEFEKYLKRYRLAWASNLIIKDPLGIGVVIGYIALKTNEVSNIRWIAQGINLGLKPDAIRSEVELVE